MSPTPVLATLALACWLTRLALLVVMHLVPSPYRAARHAVSDYAVGTTRTLALTASWVSAPAWALTAAALQSAAERGHDRSFVVGCLAALAVLAVVVGFVPTDLEGARLTPRGALHYVIAITAFGLSYAPMSNVVHLAEAAGWFTAGTLSALAWLTGASLIAVCCSVVGPLRSRVFALAERLFLGSVLAFYATSCLGLIL